MKLISRSGLFAAGLLMAVVLSSLSNRSFAGKPKAPPAVPIHYEIQFFSLPGGGEGSLSAMNNERQAAGNFLAANGERHAWYYDPLINLTEAIDVNAIPMVQVPDGWANNWLIASASGLNDRGAIVGRLTHRGDVNITRGYILNLTPNPSETNPQALPELLALPDTEWSDTRAWDINNQGLILGGNFARLYFYHSGLYDSNPDEAVRWLNLNFWSVPTKLSETGSIAGWLANADGTAQTTAFRFIDGTNSLEVFPDLGGGVVYDINALGDFCGRTSSSGTKGKPTWVPFRVVSTTIQRFPSLAWPATAMNSQGDLAAGGGALFSTSSTLYLDAFGAFNPDDMVVGANTEIWRAATSKVIWQMDDPVPPGVFSNLTGSLTFSNGVKGFFLLTPTP